MTRFYAYKPGMEPPNDPTAVGLVLTTTGDRVLLHLCDSQGNHLTSGNILDIDPRNGINRFPGVTERYDLPLTPGGRIKVAPRG